MISLMCKVDCAAHVNLNTPGIIELTSNITLSIRYNNLFILTISRLSSYNYLDIDYKTAYIILHFKFYTIPFDATQFKNRTTQNSWCTQPASRTCPGKQIPEQSFFRSTRFDSGQIRDAAFGPHRWHHQGTGGRRIRHVAPHFLSSRTGLLKRRTGRFIAASTRPQGGAQTHCRCDDVHQRISARARSCQCPRSCPIDQDRTCARCASAQYRTCPGTQKKTIHPNQLIEQLNQATERYEALRSHALFGSGSRIGLAAVVHHGMIGGLTKVTADPQELNQSRPCSCIDHSPAIRPVSDNPALIQLLATMVLRVHGETINACT